MVLPSLSAVTLGATGLMTSLTLPASPRSALARRRVLALTSTTRPSLAFWRTTRPSTSLMEASVGATASLGARPRTNLATLALFSARATSTGWLTGSLVSRCQKSEYQDSSGPVRAWSTACSTAAPCPKRAGVTRQRLSPPTTSTLRRSFGSVVALTAATAWSRVMPPTSTPATVTPARIRPDEALTRVVAATLMVASGSTARPTTTATRCQPDSPAGRFQPGSRISGTFIYLVPPPSAIAAAQGSLSGRRDELTDRLGQNPRPAIPGTEANQPPSAFLPTGWGRFRQAPPGFEDGSLSTAQPLGSAPSWRVRRSSSSPWMRRRPRGAKVRSKSPPIPPPPSQMVDNLRSVAVALAVGLRIQVVTSEDSRSRSTRVTPGVGSATSSR